MILVLIYPEFTKESYLRQFITLFCFIFATSVYSGEIEVGFGGVSLTLPEPKNLCRVNEFGPTAELYEVSRKLQLQATNKLLAYYADCSSVQSFKSMDTFFGHKDWILVVAANPYPSQERVYRKVKPHEFNSIMLPALSKLDFDEAMSAAQIGLDEVLEDVAPKMGEAIDLGVVAIDDAIHQAVIMPITRSDGSQKTIGGIFSYMIVDGVITYTYNYRDYKNKNTIESLLAESKSFIIKFANIN